MKAEEVARYLHLGKNTIYALAKSGKLASYHVGRKLKFTLEDVEAYIASTRQATALNPAPSSDPPTAGDTSLRDRQDLLEAASFDEIEGDPFVIAGADQAADIVASALNMRGTPATRLPRVSYTALVNLYAGNADAAVVNLYDQASNSWNVPYVRSLAPGSSVIVIRLYGRKQGLIVQDRNPKHLNTWGSLLHEGVRLSNRAMGSGSRVLLDEKLRSLDARSESIEGYGNQAYVGATAIRRVASGLADVAIGHEREARHINGVEFVPLQTEWVDIVIRKTSKTRAAIREIKEALRSESTQHELAALSPCDTSKLGVIVYEN